MGKTFNNFMKSLGDSLGVDRFLQAAHDYITFMGLMNRPVGIVTKNYGFVRNTLYRNIGSGLHDYDGYGSVIGTLSDFDYNAFEKAPWFYIDEKKNSTSNYLQYINSTYFDGDGITNNFVDADTKIAFFDNSSLLLDNNKVGAIRSYTVDGIKTAIDGSNLQTNPNSFDDTRLGAINNFYLNATLYNSRNIYNERIDRGNSITSGVYSRFGFDGDYGIENGEAHSISGRVLTQDELLGDLIPWSTTDHNYNSYVVGGGGQGNLNTVKNIFNLSNDEDDTLSIHYNDNAKQTNVSNLYYPFGNFYSITYSLGLTTSSNKKTQEYIAKSMYGYDLFSNVDVSLDYDAEAVSEMESRPKKYYVGNGTRGTNYVDAMSGTDVKFIKYDEKVVRMQFPDMGNDNLWSTRALYTYGEAEGGKEGTPDAMSDLAVTYNDGAEYGRHIVYNSGITSTKKDIIHYTNKRFLKGDYDTLISRFHSNNIGIDGSRGNRDVTSTALSQYGMSHGRNLLKVKPTSENGYDNPYCRVWTYHHQYHSLKDVIRPFTNEDGSPVNMETTSVAAYRTSGGIKKLEKYGVKGSNRLIQIAPTNADLNSKGSVKNCMFSIENLAWKGEKNFFQGHEEQKGPLGGRIMWFPPYDLRFSENVGINWSQNQFIGRGESIYTYTNTERSGQLSFKLLIDHPSIINQWRGDIKGGEGIGDIDDVESNEQQLLRFFAGCEILQAQMPETKNQQPLPTPKKVVKKVEKPTTTYDELVFYVFYPNNYSGVDDDPSGVVKPMEYLVNGIGANKFLFKGENMSKDALYDLPTTFAVNYPGYEMSKSTNGISTTNVTNQNGVTSASTLTTKNNNRIGYQYCSSNKAGKPNYWAYRCDKRYENQVLHTYNGDTKINYYDIKTFALNGSGFSKLTDVHKNDEAIKNKGRLFSFADVFCAIQPEGKEVLNGDYNEENVNIISEILGLNKEGYTIKGIEVKGFASSHGYNASNDILGKNRAETIKKWLQHKHTKFKNIEFNYDVNEIGDKLSDYNSNSFLAKVWRCSRVAIKIQKEEILVQSELVDVPKDGIDNITYADNQTYNEIQKAVDIAEASKSKNYTELSRAYLNKTGEKLSNLDKAVTVNQLEQNNAEYEAKMMSAKTNGDTSFIMQGMNYGYKDEYKFFSELGDKEPFLHRKVVQKIKYFDPAFHSITPEGFQSRLTFLHQCTRQGNTASASDVSNNSRTANNLAFGRPPICVLRIGDFYNTKIIIDSLNIDYDDTTWDLNDEGIGVMPMIANVSISFKFLGGSDLSGPINRLQNALSFNHYANTIVYDNRAEEVEYNDKGEIIKFNYKPEV